MKHKPSLATTHIAVEMHETKWRSRTYRKVAIDLCAALDAAKQHGIIVTVEQRPLRPLSMGRAQTHLALRPSREVYKKRMAKGTDW